MLEDERLNIGARGGREALLRRSSDVRLVVTAPGAGDNGRGGKIDKGIEVNDGVLLIAIDDLMLANDPSPSRLVPVLCVTTFPAGPGWVPKPRATMASVLS